MDTEKLSPHFRASEFRCKCNRPECDAKPMLHSFLERLEILRLLYGKPLLPSSGSRCAYWNKKVGGAPQSQHLLGNAVDFNFGSLSEVKDFIVLAEKAGFKGIGQGKRLVHLDDRKKYARWTYKY